MKIKFTKALENQHDSLAVIRQDGSISEVSLESGHIQHDLMHYAVETSLQIRGGFLDLVMGGRAISDFDAPESEWDFVLPNETAHVEIYVGLLQLELWNNQHHEDFSIAIQTLCHEQGLDMPRPIGVAKLQEIRERYTEINGAFENLAPGESLELDFELGEKPCNMSMGN